MDLVKRSENGKVITTSKLVAEKFGKNHFDVLRAIRNLECSLNFSKRNFASLLETKELPTGGRKNYPYIAMTRDGFSFLVMGFTGKMAAKFKEEFINAFNEMEQKINTKIALPNFSNPAEAARAWADQFEKAQLAEKEVKALEPKGKVYDQISESGNLLTLNEAAKSIGIGRNNMMRELRLQNILRRNNTPFQAFIDRGYFEVKVKPIVKGEAVENYTQTFVTGKGLVWLSKKLAD